MAVNKVEVNGETILDLTNDNVTPEMLAEGVTAHNAAGERITGTKIVDTVPTYHYVEAGRVIKAILDFKESHPNNIVFGTISDNHVNLSKDSEMRSARHACFALETVGAMAGCDFVANLGDNIVDTTGIAKKVDGVLTIVEPAYSNALYMERASRSALNRITTFNLIGNHDKADSTQMLYDIIGKYNDFDVKATTEIRGYGYKDFTDKKVRVITLNTCDYWNAIGGYGMSYEQKDFLMKALDVSSKGDGWQITILSHIPLDYKGGDYNTGADLKTILTAYANGTTASITVNSTYASRQNESSKYSGTLTYNYAGKNSAKIIANIHGHIHSNAYGKLKYIDTDETIDVIRIATPNSAFSQNGLNNYPNNGDYAITTEEANKIKKYADTKADTSATFYCVDLEKQTIYSIGYGADIDRTIPYKEAVVHTVVYALTNVTSDNNSATVIEGTPFTTTLSVGKDYAIDTVTVTMGGVDITSTVYSNGVINIASVTGDIVITASAVDSYVPHWDISDRTAITNVYETASKAHTCVTSRHNYIYGISDTGLIDYRQISDVVVSGNDVTFKSGTANYNIGLPYQLEAGASYTFKATANISARLRVAVFDATGKFINGPGSASSSGTNLSHTFTAHDAEGCWTVLMLDVRTAGNTTTFSNISLTKN